ncbi:MAG: Uma2 family endonuclease [Cyanophyceae cyanobacterium]
MAITTGRLTLDDYLIPFTESSEIVLLANKELALKRERLAVFTFPPDLFPNGIKRLGRDWATKQMVIGIQSPRGDRWDTVRIPDVVVLPLDQWRELQNREAVIRLGEPPPLLIVEVVSESTRGVDYRAKRAEYSVLDIPEYWIIDSLSEQVTLLTLTEGWYDAQEFTGSDVVRSPTFPDLAQSVEEILKGEL